MTARLTGLWRHADFMRLWTGQTISVFGSMIGGAALSFTAILVVHATPFELGVLAAAGLAPAFLTSLVAGAWVDRLPRRPILIAADAGRALALLTIPLAAFAGVLRIEQLYAVAFVVSILTIFFDVAYQAYLPELVSREELVDGNSKLSASAAVAEIGGFGVAGWLVQWFTAPLAILLDALSFVASAVSVGLIRTPEPPAPPVAQPNLTREVVEGLVEVWRSPLLRSIALCTLTLELSGGIYGALVVLYMSQGLGFEPGILTMFWAVGGISSFLGAALATRVTRRLGIGRAMIAGLLLSGCATLLIPLAQGATLAAALLLIAQQLFGDGAYTVYEINQVSLRQSIVAGRRLGRVNASLRFVALGATLAGALLGGVLGETIGVRPALAGGGICMLLSTLWLVFSPLRRLQVAPAPDPEEAGEGASA
jgi:MFS family permease